MDPVTHSLAALVVGRACLPAQRARATRYATAALVVAANVPDLDILYWLAGPLPFLEHNRGWMHSVAAAAALAAAVALVTQALGRRRGQPSAARLGDRRRHQAALAAEERALRPRLVSHH